MKKLRVYQCEDSIPGILSAIYDAGKSGYGHAYIRFQTLSVAQSTTMDMFSEYVWVDTDEEKAEMVSRSVRNKISEKAFYYVMRALSTEEPDKADVVYQFIVHGFAMGKSVTEALQIDCVARVFMMDRNVGNEVHHFFGFLRFQEIYNEPSVLLAVFEPHNDILDYVMVHFADRLNKEYFLIYDARRGKTAVHIPYKGWYIQKLSEEEKKKFAKFSLETEEYAQLWQSFFASIAIEERENPALQQNNLPKRFRKYMPEFSLT